MKNLFKKVEYTVFEYVNDIPVIRYKGSCEKTAYEAYYKASIAKLEHDSYNRVTGDGFRWVYAKGG